MHELGLDHYDVFHLGQDMVEMPVPSLMIFCYGLKCPIDIMLTEYVDSKTD